MPTDRTCKLGFARRWLVLLTVSGVMIGKESPLSLQPNCSHEWHQPPVRSKMGVALVAQLVVHRLASGICGFGPHYTLRSNFSCS